MTASRPRPKLHFTPVSGWQNDPHGIVHDGEKYHLFFQYVPGKTEWDSPIFWGHATSTDLVHWQEVAPALEPLNEVGCWSGSAVIDHISPILFYTRPTAEDWGRGMVVSARSFDGLNTWQRTSEIPIIDGPPTSQDFIDFRDPQVRRDGDIWKMVVGAGIRGFGGTALQFSSEDLASWNFDGVLASREKDAQNPVTGEVWECPQFFQVDGRWVLLMAAMTNEVFAQTRYAIGDYDGLNFTAQHWGTFGHTLNIYAPTTFTDVDGRPCVMSWIREENQKTPEGSPWAGAQSLVQVLSIHHDRLVATLHPNLEGAQTQTVEISINNNSFEHSVPADQTSWRVTTECSGSGTFVIHSTGTSTSWNLEINFDNKTLKFAHPGKSQEFTTHFEEAGTLDIVLDAEQLVVCYSTGEGVYQFHAPVTEVEVVISASGSVTEAQFSYLS